MQIFSSIRVWAAAALILFLALGCDGERGVSAPWLARVHGKVYRQGVPLQGGTIVFIPDAGRGGEGPLARAEIQPDGTYTLRTGDAHGAVPGFHRVTVLATDQPGAAPLSRKYRDPELSGLEREVKPGQDNTINFDLE